MAMNSPKGINVAMCRPHLHNAPNAPLPAGCSLHALARSDEPQLATLLSLAFAESWDEQRVRSALTQAEDVKAVYGVMWQGELVATASSQFLPEQDRRSGFVHWLATHPEHRGRGLAGVLVKRVLEDFDMRSYESARLLTQPERLPAIRLYLKFGFVPEYAVGKRDDRNTWSDVLSALVRKV